MASIIKSNTYADFNGREILTANNDGALTTQKINYPAFQVRMDGDQTLTSAILTKIEFDTEDYDTNSMYDVSNYRFTPTIAGRYFFYCSARMSGEANSNLGSHQIALYKNGSIYHRVFSNPAANYGNSSTLTLNVVNSANGSSDYYEIFIYILDTSGSPKVLAGTDGNSAVFGGYRLGS